METEAPLERSQTNRWRRTATKLAWVIALTSLALAVKAVSIALPVWSFEEGVINCWGGRYNAYLQSPSWARTYLAPDVHRTLSGHSLRITVHREKKGFAGVWLGFYPGPGLSPDSFDARTYRFLSFWIIGQKGGEEFEIQLADDRPEEREETLPRRPVRAYLPNGVSTGWQEVLIPLSDFPGVDRRRLVNVVLNFPSPGDYCVYLDDLALKRVGWAVVWPSKTVENKEVDRAYKGLHRVLWVWNFRKLFERPVEMEQFFDFCSREKIREVFLALDLVYRITARGPGFKLQNPDGFRRFLERAHREGLEVHALAGNPEWAVRENHLDALDAVEVTLAFNRSMAANARFDGIHFDVEPNALIEYADPVFRRQLLMDFLAMIAKCVERVRSGPGLRFGCDVSPSLYPATEAGRQDLLVTFNLEEKTVGEHLIDLVDTVTLLDYNNQAGGANGIIAAALPALAYANSVGKKIVLGLDTFAEPDRIVYFVCSIPLGEFHQRLSDSGMRTRLFVGDFRLLAYSHSGHVHVGLVSPPRLEGAVRGGFDRALRDLALQLGAVWGGDDNTGLAVVEEARAALRRDLEWEGFEPFQFKEPVSGGTIYGFRTTQRASARTTFHGVGRIGFLEETRSVVEWLAGHPGFGGFAFHDYESFRTLMEGPKQ